MGKEEIGEWRGKERNEGRGNERNGGRAVERDTRGVQGKGKEEREAETQQMVFP